MTKKIIINSNIKYKTPLFFSLESLINSGFEDFDNLVIIQNGAEQNKSPEKIPLSKLLDTNKNKTATLICTETNNLDVTGFDVLFRYKDHELVKADAYLYLPDTVTFDKNFAKKFEQLFVMPFEIRTCKSPHSFICAFDSNIINRYKDVFSQHKINKQQIIQLEMWDTIQELSLNSITTFGIRTYSKDRVYLFSAEIYKKGHKRACFFYPEFGIFKWMNGNFKGTYNSLPEDVT